jgi:hypothetical protein
MCVCKSHAGIATRARDLAAAALLVLAPSCTSAPISSETLARQFLYQLWAEDSLAMAHLDPESSISGQSWQTLVAAKRSCLPRYSGEPPLDLFERTLDLNESTERFTYRTASDSNVLMQVWIINRNGTKRVNTLRIAC